MHYLQLKFLHLPKLSACCFVVRAKLQLLAHYGKVLKKHDGEGNHLDCCDDVGSSYNVAYAATTSPPGTGAA